MPSVEIDLTELQRNFAEEYINCDFNGTEAYRRANPEAKNPDNCAYTMLQNPKVRIYIQALKKKYFAKRDLNPETILEEYRRIALSDTRDFFDGLGNLISIHELSDEAQACIASFDIEEDFLGNKITKKVKRFDKVKALDALGKHMGLFEADNSQKRMSIKVNIEDDEPTPDK